MGGDSFLICLQVKREFPFELVSRGRLPKVWLKKKEKGKRENPLKPPPSVIKPAWFTWKLQSDYSRKCQTTPWSRNEQHIVEKKNYKCGKVPEWTPEELREVPVRRLRNPRKPRLSREDEADSSELSNPWLFTTNPPPFGPLHHGASVPPSPRRPVGEKLGDEPDSRARTASGQRPALILITLDSFFLIPWGITNLNFSFLKSILSKLNMLLIWCVLYMLLSRGNKSDACPANPPAPGGGNTDTHGSLPPLRLFPTSYRIIYLFANDTKAKSPGVKAVHPCGWEKKQKIGL